MTTGFWNARWHRVRKSSYRATDILALGVFRGIRILGPAAFLDELERGEAGEDTDRAPGVEEAPSGAYQASGTIGSDKPMEKRLGAQAAYGVGKPKQRRARGVPKIRRGKGHKVRPRQIKK